MRILLISYISIILLSCASQPPSKQEIIDGRWITYYNQGTELKNKGDFTNAIQKFNEAIRLNPYYAATYNNRGVAY